MITVKAVESAILNAEFGISKLTDEILAMEGMSGHHNRHFLNNIVAAMNPRYLEIGCWKGSTLISALYDNHTKYAIGIDNFCEFGGPREELKANCKKFLGFMPNFIDEDCFTFNPVANGITDIDLYYYDGGHSRTQHTSAITHYANSLAKEFVLIVDDWNWGDVVSGTKIGLEQSQIGVVKDWSFLTPNNETKETWWNGYYIAICKKL